MIKNYFKIALRNLRINKSYTLLNIAGLGAGMTGAILIFFFLQFQLKTDRHQPGFENVYRVVLDLLLDEGTEHGTGSSLPLTEALLHDYPQVEKAGFIKKIPKATISSADGNRIKRFVENENIVFANQDFMDMFAFSWVDKNGLKMMNEPYKVIINEKMAKKYFGTTDVSGRVLRLDNTINLSVAGVIKDDSRPSDLHFDMYISLPTLKKADPAYETHNYHWVSVLNFTYIRLKEGADAGLIQQQLKARGPEYYGDVSKYYDHRLQPLSEVHFDERYDGRIRRSVLWILASVGCFLLIIAAINFVNMATAQALRRSKEIGVRKVLGSSRSQLFWQFMNETVLLTIAAAILAIASTALLLPVLISWTDTQVFHLDLLFNREFALFLLITIVFVSGIAGFYPAVIISGFNPLVALKSKSGVQKVGGITIRRSLTGVQLVIAQVLVIGTLVLMLQLKFFQNADPGFDKDSVITVPLPESGLGLGVKKTLKDGLMQYQEIGSVTYQYEAPTSTMGYGGSVRFDNRADWEKFMIRDRFGDESYINTYRIPLLAGRNIAVRDSVTEFVVNEEFMKKVGISEPQKILGKQLEDGNSGFKGEIVGVVKSFHLKSLQEAIEPCAIFAHPKFYKEAAIRINSKDMAKTLENIKQVWKQNYPDEVYSYQFVDEEIGRFYNKEQQLTSLIRSFSILAILICCLGLYGMVSFMTAQKTKEIGIRKVLGAGVDSIILLFGKEFILLVVISFVVAAPIGWYLMRTWLDGFAYRINFQWWIPALGGLSTLMITLLTVGYRVIKAALMNPVQSIGTE